MGLCSIISISKTIVVEKLFYLLPSVTDMFIILILVPACSVRTQTICLSSLNFL